MTAPFDRKKSITAILIEAQRDAIKSRPGMTPSGFFCDCRFPSSAATHQQRSCGAKVPQAKPAGRRPAAITIVLA
jgi:hypothetical protein